MADEESGQGGAFDESRLSRLIELMKEHGLSEVELCDADQQIRISRSLSDYGPAMFTQVPPSGYAAQPAAAPQAAETPAEPASSDAESVKIIKSPMVGTFYSKPNPTAPSFVKVGDHVEPESTICIIEAMKVFNEIPAEMRGKVVAVLVDDEEAVEFGKPLFKVDTKG